MKIEQSIAQKRAPSMYIDRLKDGNQVTLLAEKTSSAVRRGIFCFRLDKGMERFRKEIEAALTGADAVRAAN
jgi:hypothetical protein